MQVKELIEQLLQLDPDLKVLVSQDPEGNSCHACSDFSVGHGEQDGYWYEFYHEEYFEDSSEPYPGDNCVVLWP